MPITSTRRVESKTIPGVFFILKNLTEGRRIELRKMLAEHQSRLNAITRDIGKAEKEPFENRDHARIAELSMQYDDIVLSDVNPTWLRWGLKGIENLDVDGKTLGVEDIMEFPSELFDEILSAIQRGTDMRAEDAKNSESPTTSGAVEGGKTSSSTATVVSAPASSKLEIVEKTSLN